MNDIFGYVRASVVTDRGLVRETNEDAFVKLVDAGVFAVADGMGGGEEGELASRWIADEIEAALGDSQDELPGVRLAAFEDAVSRANGRIVEERHQKGFAQMGSTVVALLLNPWRATSPAVGHVGDSRAYRLRGGSLTRLTTDHTVGAELARQADDGSFADVRASRLSHVLTRTVGMSERMSVAWTDVELSGGDRLLLCTDGITTLLDDERLGGLLASAVSPEDACSRLSQAVKTAGATDNFTAVVLFVAGLLPTSARHDEIDEADNAYLMKRFLK